MYLLKFFVLLFSLKECLSFRNSSCHNISIYVNSRSQYYRPAGSSLCAGGSCYDHHSIKRDTMGNQCSECERISTCSYNCIYLSRAIDCAKIHKKSFIAIRLNVSEIKLHSNVTIINRRNIGIYGNLKSKTSLTCPEQIWMGILFKNTHNVFLSNLKVQSCGNRYPYPGKVQNIYLFAAVMFIKCTEVHVNKITVTSSHGIGMAMFNAHNVIVTKSHFSENHMKGSSRRLDGCGGGMHITISKMLHHNSSYIRIERSTFTHNTKHRKGSYAGLQSGGGLQIRLTYSLKERRSGASNVNIHIFHCNFTHNEATWGGGLYIGILLVSNNNILVEKCKISHNKATDNKGWGNGGGLDVGFYLGGKKSKNLAYDNNTLNFTDVEIKYNEAIQGGGTTVYSAYKKGSGNHVIFNRCIWSFNMANYSSAILVSPNYFKTCQDKFAFTPVFIDCQFTNNTLYNYDIRKKYEIGRKYVFGISSLATFTVASGLRAELKGTTNFTNNNGTALDVYFSKVFVNEHSILHFQDNRGMNGGALSISGFSAFIVNEKSSVFFYNNMAETGGAVSIEEESQFSIGTRDIQIHFENNTANFGGAIYYNLGQKQLLSNVHCFLNTETTSSHSAVAIIFRQNKALTNFGDIMYASTIKPCITYCMHVKKKCPYNNKTKIEDLLKCCLTNVTYDDSYNKKAIFTSSQKIIPHSNETILAQPGELIKLEITVYDELQNDITRIKTFKVSAISDSGRRNDSNFRIDFNLEYTSTRAVRVYGKPNTTGKLILQVHDSSKLSAEFNIKLIPCPPGYSYEKHHKQCVCQQNKYLNIFCNDHNRNISSCTILGTWVGYVDNTLTTASCPIGHCKTKQSAGPRARVCNLPSNKQELSHFICEKGRQGTLCGECVEGYSAAYHSSLNRCIKDSEQCEYGIGLYIIAEWIPVTVLFIFVLLCNINFTSGAINGFILFAQTIDVMYINGANNTNSTLMDIHTFVYGVLNFYFDTTNTRLSFCIWKGATALDILMMKYVTILYSLVLVLCLVKFLSHCTCYRVCRFCRKQSFGSSIIYGLSAFLLMCYSECIRVTLMIIQPALLHKEGPKLFKTVVHVQGNVEYFGDGHLLYATTAIMFFLVFIASPPMVLFFNSCMTMLLQWQTHRGNTRLSHKWTNRILMMKFKPMFDAFQGCFNDRHRFFAGLYFVYKVVFLTLKAVLQDEMSFYVTSLIILVAILALHAYTQPYKAKSHNIMDSLLLMNTTMINAISIYLLYYSNINYVSNMGIYHVGNIRVLQLVLVYSPILFIVFGIAYKFLGNKLFCNIRAHPLRHYLVQWKLSATNKSFQDELPARLLSGSNM